MARKWYWAPFSELVSWEFSRNQSFNREKGMDNETAREMARAIGETTGLTKDALASAAAGNLLASALAGAMFELVPESRGAIEETLRAALQNAVEAENAITEQAARLALQFIGSTPG